MNESFEKLFKEANDVFTAILSNKLSDCESNEDFKNLFIKYHEQEVLLKVLIKLVDEEYPQYKNTMRTLMIFS